jgi:hypothetical protein
LACMRPRHVADYPGIDVVKETSKVRACRIPHAAFQLLVPSDLVVVHLGGTIDRFLDIDVQVMLQDGGQRVHDAVADHLLGIGEDVIAPAYEFDASRTSVTVSGR